MQTFTHLLVERAPATMSYLSSLVVLLGLSALVLASDDKENDGYKTYEKTTTCYQCAYSPGKTEYKVVVYKGYDKDHYGNQREVVKTKKIPVKKAGGWGPCKGPFTEYEAKDYGIDVWDCHDNCYSRVDKNGNIFRGCYKDEYGVDPNLYGCNIQAGSLYCFCKGDNCNNQAVPAFSGF